MHQCVTSIHPKVSFYLKGYCLFGGKQAEITFLDVMLANESNVNAYANRVR